MPSLHVYAYHAIVQVHASIRTWIVLKAVSMCHHCWSWRVTHTHTHKQTNTRTHMPRYSQCGLRPTGSRCIFVPRLRNMRVQSLIPPSCCSLNWQSEKAPGWCLCSLNRQSEKALGWCLCSLNRQSEKALRWCLSIWCVALTCLGPLCPSCLMPHARGGSPVVALAAAH